MATRYPLVNPIQSNPTAYLLNCADLLCCQYKIFYLLINVGRWSFTQTDKRAGWRKMLLLGLTWLLIMGKNRILIGNGFIKWKLINKLHCISTGLCWFIVLSLTSGKKITNEKVFKYQSAGDKTIEIVESAKLPQLAHHLRPIFGLVLSKIICWRSGWHKVRETGKGLPR